ncbi:uncharacterized protein TM35_000041770 [Trypanosoma theileri]|uniref:Uncharacterized protein n=1 Tax=Trypanosoma theileri TaxID=67003 RepID=A0A1X0P5P2_9TRYP|nr:uncharacterized protein TM35_000041770 [Trypanosoma theileri]ORC91963.1 hypothetical protein TM35_000041770 [Trypanosoma theileri]
MRQSSVKVLHSRRHEIKQRLLQRNLVKRDELRQSMLGGCREQSTNTNGSSIPVSDAYAFIEAEFQCDVNDPHVLDLLLAVEEEIRNEQLLALYEENQDEDWEAYYKSLANS